MASYNEMKILAIFSLLSVCLNGANADRPCAARPISGQSVVCVCNETYCDDVTRTTPGSGQYVTYTSSEGGLRFEKAIGTFESNCSESSSTSLRIDPRVMYQVVEGFGGAVTDSAGMNWKNLSETLQTSLINSYFSDSGLEYNMLRVPVGGSDFSTHPYAYNELPENDMQLSNYSLSYEDYAYKLPMIKQIMKTASTPIHIVATTWSPPTWMKNSHKFGGFGKLLKEYYQCYADYHLKFLEKYREEGVEIWAFTTTNEPINGLLGEIPFNCLGWTSDAMGNWIVNNFGPTIRNSNFKNVKILAHDDQRSSIPIWLDAMIEHHPDVLQYIDGVAVHFYTDPLVSAAVLSMVPKKYPGKFVIATEASEGTKPDEPKVDLGSWKRAQSYIKDILDDLNHDVVGWIDWNLCLDEQGGPNWVKNYVDAPIIVFPQNQEYIKQPMFYAVGHLSKFVPRNSIRIKVEEENSKSSVKNVAFLTPRGTVVVVLHNSKNATAVTLKIGDQQANLNLETSSITTVEFDFEPFLCLFEE